MAKIKMGHGGILQASYFDIEQNGEGYKISVRALGLNDGNFYNQFFAK